MSRYTKTQVTQLSANEQAAINNINKNFDDIETAIKDTVSRSGNTPTHMTEDLDMNGKRIINLPAPKTDTDPVRRQDVVSDIALVQSLVNATTNAAAQTLKAAADVQEIIQDANVGLVADDLGLGENSKIRQVAANKENIDTVASLEDDISTVVDLKDDIPVVVQAAEDIDKVEDIAEDITAVANNSININAVAGNEENINIVAVNTTDVSNVATNMDDINDCANNIAAISGASTQAQNAANSADSAAQSAQLAQEAALSITNGYDLLDHKWSDHLLNDQNWLRADTFSWQDGTVYSDAYDHLVADYNGGTSQTETVGSYTITYVLASDGHKITTDETNVANIYNESGVAWYYILDTTNTRFKLPRENPAREELIQVIRAKGNGKTLGLYNGSIGVGIAISGLSGSTWRGVAPVGEYGGNVGNAGSVVQDTGGNNIISGLTTDSTKSGIISSMTDSTSVYKGKKYLYFYVGQFSQTATEQTAGLNAELFNGKLDLDLGNITNASKATIVSFGMPDYTTGVQLSYSSGTEISYNEDVVLYVGVSNLGKIQLMKDNSNGQILVQFNEPSGQEASCYLMVPKNTVVYVNTISGNNFIIKYQLKGNLNA